MSKSRHNNTKLFDNDDYEYEQGEFYSYTKHNPKKRKDKYEEISLRREQKNRAKSNTFLRDNDDWD